jgi:DNA-directed RNA polymerase subunit RPC12/RpoP
MASPLTRVALPPPACRTCGVETVIRLEHLAIANVDTIVWHCLRCHRFWRAAGRMRVSRADGGAVCPRCTTEFAALTLLTSMTRYYECVHCGHRWNEAVVVPPDLLDATAVPIETV